jgi:hypothetical protein
MGAGVRAAVTVVLGAGAFVAIAGTPACAAPVGATLADVVEPTKIAAYGGRVVWSTYDPATKRYTLTQHAEGTTSAVPVATREVPFDVDLGPGPDGETIASYSRCRRERRYRPDVGNEFGIPYYQFGGGCDLFLYTFERGEEIKVRGASSRRGSEFLPTVWGDRLAFARSHRPRRGGRSRVPSLYLRKLSGSTRSQRVSPGPAGYRRGALVSSLDLRGRRLGFLWRYSPRPRLGRNTDVDVFQVRLSGQRSKHSKSIVEVRVSGDDALSTPYLSSPLLFGGDVYYFFGLAGEGETARIQRFSPSTRETHAAADFSVLTGISVALDGQFTYFVKPLPYTDIAQRRFEIARTQLSYRPLP